MLIVVILCGLTLFFTFIISMKVGNGIISSLWYDMERARQRQIGHSRQTGYVIREYKRTHLGGRKHLQADLAWSIALASMVTFIAGALYLGWYSA